MNKDMVSFLKHKPVVDTLYTEEGKMVFKLSRDFYEVGESKANLNIYPNFYYNYDFIVKDVREAKAFKDFKFIVKLQETIYGYDQNNRLAGKFEIMDDNSIFKIISKDKKINIIDIELGNYNIVDRYEDIKFEEPLVVERKVNEKKKKGIGSSIKSLLKYFNKKR